MGLVFFVLPPVSFEWISFSSVFLHRFFKAPVWKRMLEKFKFGVFFGFPGSKWIVSGKSFWTRLVGRTRIVTAGLVDLRVRVSGFLGILCYPYGVWVEVIGTSFLSLRPGLPPKDTEDRLVGSRIDRTSEANEDDVGATGDCKESNWSGCIVSSGRRCPTYNHAVPLYSITRRRTHRSEERRVGKECRSRWSPYN